MRGPNNKQIDNWWHRRKKSPPVEIFYVDLISRQIAYNLATLVIL